MKEALWTSFKCFRKDSCIDSLDSEEEVDEDEDGRKIDILAFCLRTKSVPNILFELKLISI